MSRGDTIQLQRLVASDPVAAPLAELHAELRQLMRGVAFDQGLPSSDAHELADGVPLLQGRTIVVDGRWCRSTLSQLARLATSGDDATPSPLARTVARGGIDVRKLLAAAVNEDDAQLAEAIRTSVDDEDLLLVLAGLTVQPYLEAFSRVAAAATDQAHWRLGYCPICGGRPGLAELRGPERRRWARCLRCAGGWEVASLVCLFCDNDDFRLINHLAAETPFEGALAATCDECGGYLKHFPTSTALRPAELTYRDLASIALDAATLEAGYNRPEGIAYPMRVEVATRRRVGFHLPVFS